MCYLVGLPTPLHECQLQSNARRATLDDDSESVFARVARYRLLAEEIQLNLVEFLSSTAFGRAKTTTNRKTVSCVAWHCSKMPMPSVKAHF